MHKTVKFHMGPNLWHDYLLKTNMVRNVLLVLFLIHLIACDDDVSPDTSDDLWLLTEFSAKTTSSCYVNDEIDPQDEVSNRILNMLLGWDDPRWFDTSLWFDQKRFIIYKDGISAMQGSVQLKEETLVLYSDGQALEMEISLKTENRLEVTAEGDPTIQHITFGFEKKRW